MRLALAEHYALKIVEWLEPFCTQIEIAGSIRRKRPECNDVDIVCIPKLERVTDLMGSTGEVRNLVLGELVRYVRQSKGGAVWRNGTEPKEDASNLLVKLPKCELDLWCATESSFATRLMCRTGSREHNIWLAERARSRGHHWNPYRGITRAGELRVTHTEEDLYEALGLEFIPPRHRELSFLRTLN